ncbi:hypothetical protein F4815DRAFT_442946 [Daldinia loculata]|nr:hypothetical protein F4815DRAFT_442946 [Daldinia loculata]
MAYLELYVAICKVRYAGDARHWLLIAAYPGEEHGTWYHVTGGPTHDKDYKLEIQTKRVDNHKIESYYKVGNLQEVDVKKLKASAQSITPKFCQRWIVDVLKDLERKSLMSSGTGDAWYQNMEVDPYSHDGASS